MTARLTKALRLTPVELETIRRRIPRGYVIDRYGRVVLPTAEEIMARHGYSREDAKEARRMEELMVTNMGGLQVAPTKRDPNGFVYFVSARETGLIKIGFARDVAKRFRNLSTMGGAVIELIASTPGTLKTERRLHKRFAADRAYGEWFRASPALLAHIEALARSA